jgi:CelD/BcsL family acetyltransferase involved in cellulose biosynthesis
MTAADLEACRALWTELESGARACSPYETFAWLSAWAGVYEPDELLRVEIEAGDGSIAAAGLIDSGRNGRWAFAGGPISGARGLLCRPGAERDAWNALARWLRAHRDRWTTLQATTATEVGMRLGGARITELAVPRIELPESYDLYVAARSRVTRKRMRQRMRRLERGGGEIREVAAAERLGALRDMVRLHGERAAHKGEVHAEVDDRLACLLDAVAAGGGPRVRVAELVVDGQRAGVSARIDHADTAYSFCDGIGVEHLDLSPGIVIELESIRDAIESGLRHYDLGPGEYEYKHNLGATAAHRVAAEIVSPSARGKLARLRSATASRLRSTALIARPARWMRAQARRRLAATFPVLEQIACMSPAVPYDRTPFG